VDKIASSIGAEVHFAPVDDELSGFIFLRGNTPIIGINSLHHPNRQRFTIAHELGHLELHRGILSNQVHVDKRFPILARNASSASGLEKIEIEANQFAAALLMPNYIIQELLDTLIDDIDDDSALEVLARKLRVSKQALDYRIRNLAGTLS
jgi:Zn-dependent peptidase ImmA (M78 family)